MDVDLPRPRADAYCIRGIPAFIIFHDCKVAEQIVRFDFPKDLIDSLFY